MDDPSGYSTVENLHLPMPDPKLEIRHYGRTQAQDNQLGFYTEEQRKVLHGEADSMDRTDEGLDVNQVNCFYTKNYLIRRFLFNSNCIKHFLGNRRICRTLYSLWGQCYV